MTRLKCSVFALFLVLAVCPGRSPAEVLSGEKAYQQALRGTVLVHVRKNGKPDMMGTGWIVDARRKLIITNHHVVGDADTAYVTFPDYKDGEVIAVPSHYPLDKAQAGRIVTTDVRKDLAVIQLPSLPAGVTELKLAEKKARPGAAVFLVGNPGASAGLWVYTSGRVRQLVPRTIRYPSGQVLVSRVLETQMPINPGDSGAALLNENGEVVGVNSGYDSRVRLFSWAIDLPEIRRLLAEVRPFFSEEGASAAAFHQRGGRYLVEGRLARAIADFTQAIRKDDALASAYRDRGRAHLLKGELATALSDTSRAIELDQDDAHAYNERGHVWYARKDYPKAIADYTRAIRLLPNDAVMRINRGQAYAASGQLDQALKDYNAGLKQGPRDARGLRERGHVYFRKSEYGKASSDYQASLQLQPDAEVYNLLGMCYQQTRDFSRAITAYGQALLLNHPQRAVVLTNRGNAFTQNGQPRLALADFTEAIRLSPSDAAAFLGRGEAHEKLGEGQQAHQDYEKAVALDGNRADRVPLRHLRSLVVRNDTGETLRVFLQYETRVAGAAWEWAPARGALIYELAPGATLNFLHNGNKVQARKMRIWAVSKTTGKQWLSHKNIDQVLVMSPYRALTVSNFVYRFIP